MSVKLWTIVYLLTYRSVIGLTNKYKSIIWQYEHMQCVNGYLM